MISDKQKEIITNSVGSKIHNYWIKEQIVQRGVELVRLPLFQILTISFSVFTGILMGMITQSQFLEISSTIGLIMMYKSYSKELGYLIGSSPPKWVIIEGGYEGTDKEPKQKYIFNFNDKNESQRLLCNLVKYNEHLKTWESDAMVPWRTYPSEHKHLIERPRLSVITYVINTSLLLMIIPCYYFWYYRIMATLIIYAIYFYYNQSSEYFRQHNSSATLHQELRTDKIIIVKNMLDIIIEKYERGVGQFEILNDVRIKDILYKEILQYSKFFTFKKRENYIFLDYSDTERIDEIFEILVKEIFQITSK